MTHTRIAKNGSTDTAVFLLWPELMLESFRCYSGMTGGCADSYKWTSL